MAGVEVSESRVEAGGSAARQRHDGEIAACQIHWDCIQQGGDGCAPARKRACVRAGEQERERERESAPVTGGGEAAGYRDKGRCRVDRVPSAGRTGDGICPRTSVSNAFGSGHAGERRLSCAGLSLGQIHCIGTLDDVGRRVREVKASFWHAV